MRVLHIVESFDNNYGGPSKSIAFLALALTKYNAINTIISVDKQYSTNDVVKNTDLKWIKCAPLINIKMFKYFSISFFFKAFFEIGKCDVVHFHSVWSSPTLIGYLYCILFKKKYYMSPRSSLMIKSMSTKSHLKKTLRKLFLNVMIRSSRCIFLTSNEENENFNSLGFINSRVKIIPNIIDFDLLSSTISQYGSRKALNIPVDQFIFTFFSRIHRRKNLHLLIENWILINRVNDLKCFLFVAGPVHDQKYFNYCLQLINNSGLVSQFKYFGVLSGIDRTYFLKSSDTFVLPSEFENFGMSIAESLSVGVPVIITKNTPWVAIDKNCGWFIDKDDLLAAMKEARTSNLNSMRNNAIEYITKNFSSDHVASLHYHEYLRK